MLEAGVGGESSSDEGEDWDHPLMDTTRGAREEASPVESGAARMKTMPGVAPARVRSQFNEAWVRALHDEIQTEIASAGMKACTWERLLERWSTHIRDAPYEKVASCLVPMCCCPFLHAAPPLHAGAFAAASAGGF